MSREQSEHNRFKRKKWQREIAKYFASRPSWVKACRERDRKLSRARQERKP